jgi:hypothetical protein
LKLAASRHLPGSGLRISEFGSQDSDLRIQIPGFGFRVSGFGFRVSSFGSQDSGFGSQDSGLRIRVSGFGSQDSGLRIRFAFRARFAWFRVSGSSFRFSGSGLAALARFRGRVHGVQFRGKPTPKPNFQRCRVQRGSGCWGRSNSHGVRPVHQIRWIRTTRLSIRNSLFLGGVAFALAGRGSERVLY